MYVRGYLQGSENGRVFTIGKLPTGYIKINPINPVVILRYIKIRYRATYQKWRDEIYNQIYLMI